MLSQVVFAGTDASLFVNLARKNSDSPSVFVDTIENR